MGNIFDTDSNDHHEKRIHVYPRHHVEHMKRSTETQHKLNPKLINSDLKKMSESISDKNPFSDKIQHLDTTKIMFKMTKMNDIIKIQKNNELLKKLLRLEYEKNQKLMMLLKLK